MFWSLLIVNWQVCHAQWKLPVCVAVVVDY